MSDSENVIRLVFNTQTRERDEEDIHAMDLMERYIKTFFNDRPENSFQLGYLCALVDLYHEMGGENYTEFAISCMEDLKK